MISYVDTSVILPALSAKHPMHRVCRATVVRAAEEGTVWTTTLHTYAELYHHLTKPSKQDIHFIPAKVEGLLLDTLPKILQFVELSQQDYEAAIRRCARIALVGAVIYDALHFEAAIRCEAEVLYTDNTKDFTRLVLPDDTIRVQGVR
ncbi:type II toxin-antitoxin system VapC family toxin [Neolewinella sp.]|uniref:type II toxin-antitoxin system VapC family toxin n=1 Tax=Neolewinella sp. TaxID=2993543 RepID=UPI003B524CBB